MSEKSLIEAWSLYLFSQARATALRLRAEHRKEQFEQHGLQVGSVEAAIAEAVVKKMQAEATLCEATAMEIWANEVAKTCGPYSKMRWFPDGSCVLCNGEIYTISDVLNPLKK